MYLPVEGSDRLIDEVGMPGVVVVEPRKQLGIELRNELKHFGFDMIYVRRGAVFDSVVVDGSLLKLCKRLLDFGAVVDFRSVVPNGEGVVFDEHTVFDVGQIS